jgi:outer membrane immunogenic protein
MTSRWPGVIAAAGIIITTSFAANAADLPNASYKAPIYTPSYFSWTGFYAGINGGYGFGKASISNAFVSTGDFNTKGAVVGGTLGYNLQTGTWVWGLEGDLDYSANKGSTSTACVPDCTVSNTWMATARGRLGYAGWDRWLPYITGGAAFGNVKLEQAGISNTKTKIGWTAGLGVEYAFLANWSAKAEYLYADLGKANCGVGTCVVDTDTKFKTNLVRLGINYRF